MYVVGEQPTTLLRVGTYSDTLEMYPDLALLRETARNRDVRAFEIEPTLTGQRSLTFARDAVVLGIAHVLRRACMNRRTISDVETGDPGPLAGGAAHHAEARRRAGLAGTAATEPADDRQAG
jgi:hypothetical protein